MDMLYQSPRKLETLAVGLIQGGSDYFQQPVEIVKTKIQDEPHQVKIIIRKI